MERELLFQNNVMHFSWQMSLSGFIVPRMKWQVYNKRTLCILHEKWLLAGHARISVLLLDSTCETHPIHANRNHDWRQARRCCPWLAVANCPAVMCMDHDLWSQAVVGSNRGKKNLPLGPPFGPLVTENQVRVIFLLCTWGCVHFFFIFFFKKCNLPDELA